MTDWMAVARGRRGMLVGALAGLGIAAGALVAAGQDAAPARVPLVPDEAAAPAAASVFAGIRAGGSAPLAMHRAVANAPEPFAAYVSLARALRRDDHVPRSVRELVILRTLQIENGAYEIDQHRRMALSCGITPDQVAALPRWRDGAAFDERQRAVLAYVEAVATPDGPDAATFAALARHYDPHGIVEITLTASFYAASARTTKALGVVPEGKGDAPGGYGAC